MIMPLTVTGKEILGRCIHATAKEEGFFKENVSFNDKIVIMNKLLNKHYLDILGDLFSR